MPIRPEHVLTEQTREYLKSVNGTGRPIIEDPESFARLSDEEARAHGVANESINWTSVARILVDVGDRRLRQYGEDLALVEDEKQALASAWGSVIRKYAPDVGQYGPETVAAITTLAILESRIRKINERSE